MGVHLKAPLKMSIIIKEKSSKNLIVITTQEYLILVEMNLKMKQVHGNLTGHVVFNHGVNKGVHKHTIGDPWNPILKKINPKTENGQKLMQ